MLSARALVRVAAACGDDLGIGCGRLIGSGVCGAGEVGLSGAGLGDDSIPRRWRSSRGSRIAHFARYPRHVPRLLRTCLRPPLGWISAARRRLSTPAAETGAVLPLLFARLPARRRFGIFLAARGCWQPRKGSKRCPRTRRTVTRRSPTRGLPLRAWLLRPAVARAVVSKTHAGRFGSRSRPCCGGGGGHGWGGGAGSAASGGGPR